MKLHFSAANFDISTDLEHYAAGKLTRLLRRVPRDYRQGGSCAVEFKLAGAADAELCTCTIRLRLDGSELTAAETTQHMYAALDIAAVRIEQQLRDFTRRHRPKLRNRVRSGLHRDWTQPDA